MRSIICLAMFMGLSVGASAGEKKCVATHEESQRNIGFIIDWEPDGTIIVFDKEIAWYPDALKFNVVYSGSIANAHIIVARTSEGERAQLVELRFDNFSMTTGILKAGDFLLPENRLGKNREYLMNCM